MMRYEVKRCTSEMVKASLEQPHTLYPVLCFNKFSSRRAACSSHPDVQLALACTCCCAISPSNQDPMIFSYQFEMNGEIYGCPFVLYEHTVDPVESKVRAILIPDRLPYFSSKEDDLRRRRPSCT